ncbi:hypothetical protein AUJ46_02235 [Candidatus Peregrinibacteria bacterium CG1_02_54_53]|nr:MAG: hypothetical protein AUJ46_02235 [Candidatus Peregrinibacteria bacterium CG1_02_54_53]
MIEALRAIGLCILLGACSPFPSESLLKQPSSTWPPPGMLEQVPAKLSLAHFARMRLEGSDLTFTGVLAENDAYTRHAITYRSNALLISGIMNIPKGDGPFPLVVFAHGYIDSLVYTQGRGLKREQDFLARQGFAVLHTDYRGHAGSDLSPDTREVYDASIEYGMDVVNAINAVRTAKLSQVDAEHVGILGHSLGGGVALNIAVTRPDLADAYVLYAPVNSDAWQNFARWRSKRDDKDRTLEVLGTRDENPDAWNALSSQTILRFITAPVLLFQGTADSDVPAEWSDDLDARLMALNRDITYVSYEGEKHEFIPKWEDFMQRTAAFLRAHLTETNAWTAPIDRAAERVTKKPFGISITPQNSPVQPERFTGYHTGTDYELLPGETPHDVTVRAACTGDVIAVQRVSGYGGVVVQRCSLNGETVTALYGHLALDRVAVSLHQTLDADDTIGVLGAADSQETDGERAHLHFAIHHGVVVEFKGYVPEQSTLDAWVDPMTVLNL